MSLNAYEIVGEKGLDGGCHVVRMLGEGGFGTVHEVVCEDGQTYALKTIEHFSPTRKTMARAEGCYSQLLSHENLVHVYAAESNLKEKKTQILMEHCVGGDLRALLEMHHSAGTRLPLDTAWSYFVQMAKVLFYLHNSSDRADGMGALGHGDVKPENMLLADEDQTILKLADLGLMRSYKNGRVNTSDAGSPAYMAPEVWKRGPSDYRADCYALGVIGFELLNGEHPFEGEDEEDLWERHDAGAPHESPDYKRDFHFACLIDALMCPNPDERMTMAELLRDDAFSKRRWMHEVEVRERALQTLENELRVERFLSQRQDRLIEAQGNIIRNLRRQLGRQPGHNARYPTTVPRTVREERISDVTSPSPATPESDEPLHLDAQSADAAEVAEVAKPAEKGCASLDSVWSATSSEDFDYSVDTTSDCSSFQDAIFGGTSSRSRTHLRGKKTLRISMSTCSTHGSQVHYLSDVSPRSSEDSSDYAAPDWLVPVIVVVVQLKDDLCRPQQRYLWKNSPRRPHIRRGRRRHEDTVAFVA